jgi:hypothetical protein
MGIGLAGATAALSIGPVDLDDADLVGEEVPGQPAP